MKLEPIFLDIYDVRSVAPKKVMLCVTLKLPDSFKRKGVELEKENKKPKV